MPFWAFGVPRWGHRKPMLRSSGGSATHLAESESRLSTVLHPSMSYANLSEGSGMEPSDRATFGWPTFKDALPGHASASGRRSVACCASGSRDGRLESAAEDGLGLLDIDPELGPHKAHLQYRWRQFQSTRRGIVEHEGSLYDFAGGFRSMGLTTREDGSQVFRDWAPGAANAWLIGDFNDWTGEPLQRSDYGVWSCELPARADGSPAVAHDSRIKIRLQHPDGWTRDCLPAWTRFARQEPGNVVYDAVHWEPPGEDRHVWEHGGPVGGVAADSGALRIYECHVGMGAEEERVGTYREFADDVLPRVADLGYNAVQLMAVQEHPYYASFGYHVSLPFAVSSRSGSPEDLKYLIDKAHGLGLTCLLDVVHSHVCKNELDGLAGYDLDGGGGGYFLPGPDGWHGQWDSRLFDYNAWEVLRMLLSNLRWWMEEYRFDGFRFDGVTSMLYHHHGINVGFTGDYNEYFSPATNVDACVYLMLANELVHRINPDAVTVAEDVSGMPGLCRRVAENGLGFDMRLGMAIPDRWIQLLKEVPDEMWRMSDLVTTLCNRRYSERTIAYAESHDQAMVGDKTISMWLFGPEIYDGMSALAEPSPVIERGMSLHKMIRAVTFAIGGESWLTFMGNEFGHPEWIDFPREGNGWSHKHCRRQWSLADSEHLRYRQLLDWDRRMMGLDAQYHVLSDPHQCVSKQDEECKLLVAERGPLVFVFNFSPAQDYEGLRVGVGEPGKYRVLLDSDAFEFGGRGRVGHDVDHFTQPGEYDERPCSMFVLAPARTVVVYKRVNEADEAALAQGGSWALPGGKARPSDASGSDLGGGARDSAETTRSAPVRGPPSVPCVSLAGVAAAARRNAAGNPLALSARAGIRTGVPSSPVSALRAASLLRPQPLVAAVPCGPAGAPRAPVVSSPAPRALPRDFSIRSFPIINRVSEFEGEGGLDSQHEAQLQHGGSSTAHRNNSATRLDRVTRPDPDAAS